jgi:TonB family protein
VLTDESRDEDEAYSPTTKEMLTGEARDEEEYSRKAFADYQPFREHSYPRQLTLFIHGIPTLKVKVSSLREISFDDTDFDPPPGAIVRRQCEHMTHPEAIKAPDPYIRSSGDEHMMGTTIVALTVLPNGSADSVHLVESAGREMDQVTQEVVKTWKFKPAMCGNEPVVYDIRVGVTFRGQGSR